MVQGATAYINATPCEICLSELLKWGIKRIVCGSSYRQADLENSTSQLVSAWSAVIEYLPSPDVELTFNSIVSEVKRVKINRPEILKNV